MSDLMAKTWRVDSCESPIGLLAGDKLSFVEPEGYDGICLQVENRSFVWAFDCKYTGASTAEVTTYDNAIYELVQSSDTQLTCTLKTTEAPSPSNFPLLGVDDLPGRGARRRVRAKGRSKRESECEFPVLGDTPPSSWTAIEGGGGGQP